MNLREHSDARVIAARKSLGEQLRQIWAYRGLLLRMVRKELQVKYKNSVLGFLWSMLNPALYLVVFFVVFDLILGSGIPDFAIFLLSGLLAWNVFATGLGSATSSITLNGALVEKVYFPREVLPLASVGAALVHFFLQGIVLLAALAIFQYDVAFIHSLAIVPALLVLLVLTAGFGLLLGAANVYLRDVQHLVELALLAWFWLTPIVYPPQLVAEKLAARDLAWAQWLNPLAPIVLTFQRGIYNVIDAVGGQASVRPLASTTEGAVHILPPDMDFGWYVAHLGGVGLFALALLVGALMVFGRLEGNFAEEL